MRWSQASSPEISWCFLASSQPIALKSRASSPTTAVASQTSPYLAQHPPRPHSHGGETPILNHQLPGPGSTVRKRCPATTWSSKTRDTRLIFWSLMLVVLPLSSRIAPHRGAIRSLSLITSCQRETKPKRATGPGKQ